MSLWIACVSLIVLSLWAPGAQGQGVPDGQLAALAKEVRDHIVTLYGTGDATHADMSTLDGLGVAIAKCHLELYGKEVRPADGASWTMKDVGNVSLKVGRELWGRAGWDDRLLGL